MPGMENIDIHIGVSNRDEFRETLEDMADEVRAVREEVQALNEELERAADLADGAPYARHRIGENEVAFLGADGPRLLDEDE